jgi:hypothetical protein
MKLRATDGLARRNRYPHEPRDPVRIIPTDLKIAAYNRMMGGIGVGTPHLFRAGSHTSFKAFEHRMTKLRQDAGLFKVGEWQRRVCALNGAALINENTELAEGLLKEHGLWVEHVPGRSGAHSHDAFQSFGYQSFYEAAPYGWSVELQHSIFGRLGLSGTLQLPSGRRVEPDATCIVQNRHRTILIFQEYDRATELMRKQRNVRESWEAKLEGYEELIETRLFRKLFELPEERTGALVCALTVDASNANAMVRVKPGKPWFRACQDFCVRGIA